MKKTRIKIIMVLMLLTLCGCVGIPEDIKPVEGFELERYLGKWYEIARFDHSFERGLTKVSATYSMMEDRGVKVVNRGFNREKDKWEEAVGKAYFVGKPDVGRLKVSFFWLFFGAYNIFYLDRKDYQYSMVCGADRSYLWILARDPKLSRAIIEGLVNEAKIMGFDTEKLIYVSHD